MADIHMLRKAQEATTQKPPFDSLEKIELLAVPPALVARAADKIRMSGSVGYQGEIVLKHPTHEEVLNGKLPRAFVYGKPHAGISTIVGDAIQLSALIGCNVHFNLEGLDCKVDKDTNPQEIIARVEAQPRKPNVLAFTGKTAPAPTAVMTLENDR